MSDRDLISVRDIDNTAILALFDLAAEFATQTRRRMDLAHDAVMATLFYEPSTRTRMSFEAAMLRLGGQVISMADPSASSAAKGETLADTVRIVEGYADIIALRHPREGAAQMSAELVDIPVINAGDGAREHPTQTLLDLYTIFQEKGRLQGVTVALCGDLKYGRTVHSLVQGLARFGAHIFCVAPPGLELPEQLGNLLTAQYGSGSLGQYDSLDSAPLDECDVLYVTRIQKERLADSAEFERLRSTYQVSRHTLTRVRDDAIVLHPLPRVDELDFSLDGDPRAAYFRQASYGVPVRMALIAALLNLRTVSGFESTAPAGGEWLPQPDATLFRCGNARCITHVEPGIAARAFVRGDGTQRCAYCDAIQEAAWQTLLIRDVEYEGEVTDLLVQGSEIIPAPRELPAEMQTIQATGLVAVPGLVDVHVHFRDPGGTDKEDLLSGARAAAAGGFVTVLCEPNTRPVIDSPEAVHAIYRRIKELGIPCSLVRTKAAITLGQAGTALTDFRDLVTAGAVAFSDDGEPIVDDNLLLKAFRRAGIAYFPEPYLTAHCEETPRSAAKIRAALGEGPALAREDDLVRMHLAVLAQANEERCGALHIQHVSMAATVERIAHSKRNGIACSAEVTPHHLLLCAEDIPAHHGEADANWKMNPPLRSREDMLALRRALADGVIDVIATDHAPHTVEEKSRDWDEAPFGVIGLETALGACLSLVHDGVLSMTRLIDAMSRKPAALLSRIDDHRASGLTLIDPMHVWTVDPNTFYSKARNCPFAGMTFKGRAAYTIADGRIIMAEGKVLF